MCLGGVRNKDRDRLQLTAGCCNTRKLEGVIFFFLDTKRHLETVSVLELAAWTSQVLNSVLQSRSHGVIIYNWPKIPLDWLYGLLGKQHICLWHVWFQFWILAMTFHWSVSPEIMNKMYIIKQGESHMFVFSGKPGLGLTELFIH